MPEFREDIGYTGVLTSLAGVKSSPGRGLVTSGVAPSVTTEEILLPPNPRRVWAFIQNTSTTETVAVQLGVQGSFYVQLLPKGSLLINENFRWTGILTGVSLGAAATVRAFEASVE